MDNAARRYACCRTGHARHARLPTGNLNRRASDAERRLPPLGESIDCSTPAGKLLVHILAARSECERAPIADGESRPVACSDR